MSDGRLAEARNALARYEDRNSKPNPSHLADALRGLIHLVTELEARVKELENADIWYGDDL